VAHSYYSQRTGVNPNAKGLPLSDIIDLFVRVFNQLRQEGYFDEAFGFTCVDSGPISGKVLDVDLEMLLSIRKKNLWPIDMSASRYSEDDLFDVIEFLFQHVSKPIDGSYHSWNDCGMHWETFNQIEGRREFRTRVNKVLDHYMKQFELSPDGEVLQKPESGFEVIFDADIPSKDANVRGRINAAVLRYRRHGSTLDDRRQAVRDLADVLEYLRPKVQTLLTSKDEKDLFNIANNFGIRHHNDKQKTAYDAALWLSWMFYFYLSTIHVVLRKIGSP
jgi:hypothetical protein